MSFERARRIADAVLYEGYLLYPYRASARKNRVRWQFGVIAPREWSEAGGCEKWWLQASCPARTFPGARVEGVVRFLRARRRSVERRCGDDETKFEPVESLEVRDVLWTSWDEGIETEVAFASELVPGVSEQTVAIRIPGQISEQPIRDVDRRVVARVVHQDRALEGRIRIGIEPLGNLVGVRVRIENDSPVCDPSASRDEALNASFLGVHVLLRIAGGEFVSHADPGSDEARQAVAACKNLGLWPVLAGEPGERDVMLLTPIILEDHPRLAPESPGDFFDATEIDELLTLRTMTLTDGEKREARATDPRAAEILDRVDNMPPEVFERLHGAIRELRVGLSATEGPPPSPLPTKEGEPYCPPSLRRRGLGGGPSLAQAFSADVPWWDPAADESFSPESDSIDVHGVRLAKGSRVRLRPGPKADAQDMFLAGRVGRVEGVFFDVDERQYLAVTIEGDPAAELQQWHGRYLYFAPDEVEPLEADS